MNKTQLIADVASRTDMTKEAAERAFDAVVESITGALQKGESVAIVNFGTFEVRRRAARQGRNPQTGETLNIPASTAPAFKPGKAFRDAV